MNRNAFPNRSQLIGLSLIGLLGLVFVLAIQTPWLKGQAISSIISAPAAAPASADASIQEAAEAADLKFQDASYMESLMSQLRTDPLAGVHPADRKFYSGEYIRGASADASIQEEAEAADLKFQDASYMEFLMSQIRTDPLAGVHPADRKFYTNWEEWVGP